MSTHRWLSRRGWFLTLLGSGSVAAAPADVMVEVWVDLSEPVPAAADDLANAEVRRQRVDSQQQEVAHELLRLGAIEIARVRHTRNAIAVRIDSAQLDAVRRITGVLRVRPAQTLHPPELLPSDPTKREPR